MDAPASAPGVGPYRVVFPNAEPGTEEMADVVGIRGEVLHSFGPGMHGLAEILRDFMNTAFAAGAASVAPAPVSEGLVEAVKLLIVAVNGAMRHIRSADVLKAVAESADRVTDLLHSSPAPSAAPTEEATGLKSPPRTEAGDRACWEQLQIMQGKMDAVLARYQPQHRAGADPAKEE